MKKRIIAATLIATLAATFCSCGGDKKQISLKEKNDVISLKTDEKYTVKVNYDGVDPIEWKSGNEAIAVVSPDGTISAVGSGITTVTASTQSGFVHLGVIVEGDGSYTDEFGNHIEVFDGQSDIQSIKVRVKNGTWSDATINSAKDGDTFKLDILTDPSDSQDTIAWRTADSSVVRVDENGVMKVVGKGKTTVSAIAPNGVKGELIVRVK